jgi:tRNA(Ile)-lysidine synthase
VINDGLADKVATAHHLSDNAESVLFNLFRGTGVKGAVGIESNFNDKIIRPFLQVTTTQIEDYISKHNLKFVTDSTNFDDDYTRNALRHKVLPQIKELFPQAEKSIKRFGEIIKQDNDFIEGVARQTIVADGENFYIPLPCHKAVFSRACIIALNQLGVKKDWGKVHVDDAFSLTQKQNGASINLPHGVVAVKEYDKITFYKPQTPADKCLKLELGTFDFCGKTIQIKSASKGVDLKSGLFVDFDKIPKSAIIRTVKQGDEFTKFGGGTKSLNDYFTDVKLALRLRTTTPIIVDGNTVYAIFGVGISELAKVDKNTKTIVELLQPQE